MKGITRIILPNAATAKKEQDVCVVIFYDATVPACAQHIQLGLEEEGVPSMIVLQDSLTDLNQAAKNAADLSRLAVGVSANQSKIVLHHQKLPHNQPLLQMQQNSPNARLIGKNAARLVKGLPLVLETHLENHT